MSEVIPSILSSVAHAELHKLVAKELDIADPENIEEILKANEINDENKGHEERK